MITAIMSASFIVIGLVIAVSIPHTYDYHTDLRNIAYQLSRIADALNRKERREVESMRMRIALMKGKQPTIEPKKGKWISKADQRWHCSLCDGIAPKGYRWNYCPDCGADMREGVTE